MWPDVMDGYIPLGDKTKNIGNVVPRKNSPMEDLALGGSAYTLIIVRQRRNGRLVGDKNKLIPPASHDGDATLSTLLLVAH